MTKNADGVLEPYNNLYMHHFIDSTNNRALVIERSDTNVSSNLEVKALTDNKNNVYIKRIEKLGFCLQKTIQTDIDLKEVFEQLNDKEKTVYDGIKTLEGSQEESTYHAFTTSFNSNSNSTGPYISQTFYFSTDSLQLAWIQADGHSSNGRLVTVYFKVLNGLVPREFTDEDFNLQPCLTKQAYTGNSFGASSRKGKRAASTVNYEETRLFF